LRLHSVLTEYAYDVSRHYNAVNVSVVMIMFFVVFGILGVNLFAGRLFRCSDPSTEDKLQCVGSYYNAVTGDVAEREWNIAYLNFDNLYA